jgi:hypothetical protein
MAAIKLTAEQEATLRSQDFGPTHPGALLHDFELVLEYVGAEGVPAAGKYNLLPIAAIPALDPRLARPLNLQLARPQLRSHPYLQGLHLLFRASGLGVVEGQGDKARLRVSPEMLEAWRGLSPTEQYFNLFDAWLFEAEPEMIGSDRGMDLNAVREWCFALQIGSEGRKPLTADAVMQRLPYRYGRALADIALIDLFGLITVEHPEAPKAWAPVRSQPTRYGSALITALAAGLGEEPDDDDDDDEETPEPNVLQSVLQPYFPAWVNNLPGPAAPEVREGTYVFKVSMGKVWRRIALHHLHSLDDFVAFILDAYDFDFDHLYEWKYRDERGRTVRAAHEFCEDEICAEDIPIGTLPAEAGFTMELTYDFGDNWRFKAVLERVDPPRSPKSLPKVLESRGKAPEQYPEWD